MTREEILEKSREENRNMDEREQRLHSYAKGISGAFGLFLCMLLNLVNSCNHGPQAVGYAMWAIACGIYAAEHFINAVCLKKKSSWVLAACFACICAGNLYYYLGSIL